MPDKRMSVGYTKYDVIKFHIDYCQILLFYNFIILICCQCFLKIYNCKNENHLYKLSQLINSYLNLKLPLFDYYSIFDNQ